jgi:integrase
MVKFCGKCDRFHPVSGLVPEKNLRDRMRGFLEEPGFPPGSTFHSLRRSYVTHMQTEYGYDTEFISMQVGH